MDKETATSVTLARCPQMLDDAIKCANQMAEMKHQPGDGYSEFRIMCRILHELAQLAALPIDMRKGYAKAVVGSAEEWERFCKRLPARLWRDWIEIEPPPKTWRWPSVLVEFVIDDSGKITRRELDFLIFMEGVEARRLRECRVCQRLFWASRIEKSGAPYGCSDQCNNTLRQRDSRARKKP